MNELFEMKRNYNLTGSHKVKLWIKHLFQIITRYKHIRNERDEIIADILNTNTCIIAKSCKISIKDPATVSIIACKDEKGLKSIVEKWK